MNLFTVSNERDEKTTGTKFTTRNHTFFDKYRDDESRKNQSEICLLLFNSCAIFVGVIRIFFGRQKETAFWYHFLYLCYLRFQLRSVLHIFSRINALKKITNVDVGIASNL